MMKFVSKLHVFTVCGLLASGLGSAALAEGAKELMVTDGTCPSTVQVMIQESFDRSQYTAFSLPTIKGGAESCAAASVPVQMGIASNASLTEARRQARAICNENRGELGHCIIAAFLRKQR